MELVFCQLNQLVMSAQVDQYIHGSEKFGSLLSEMRELILDCGLEETWKWKQPCYTFQGKNVVIIGELKARCTFGFFKGALLNPDWTLLKPPGKYSNETRVISLTTVEEFLEHRDEIRAILFEAVEVERMGLKFERKFVMPDFPEELLDVMDRDPEFKLQFESLTPGRRKGYALHIAEAKQPQTRYARIEKFRPKIKVGKGMWDCICGMSQKMPRCDGSHKYL